MKIAILCAVGSQSFATAHAQLLEMPGFLQSTPVKAQFYEICFQRWKLLSTQSINVESRKSTGVALTFHLLTIECNIDGTFAIVRKAIANSTPYPPKNISLKEITRLEAVSN